MAIVTNKNTAQNPITGVGRLSTQTIRHIEAPRVYLLADSAGNTKTVTEINTPVQDYFVKSNGATPTLLYGSTDTWLDLGIVDGYLKLNYNKNVKQITTGIDQVFRAAYVDKKVGTLEASLDQFSDYVLEKVSGLTASVVTAGSIVNYQVGQEDLNQCGILFVSQNKLDGQEWQFFNPNCFLNFVFEQKGDAMALKMTGYLPFFTAQGQTVQGMLSSTIFQ